MIKLMRVDHRLLHGQVAISWTKNLDVDCILIANNDVPVNDLRKTTLKMAKPQEVKLVIKNIEDSIQAIKSGVTDKYKLFIVVESIEDAYRLGSKCDGITQINLGGTKKNDDTHSISKLINVTDKDQELLQKLISKDIELEIRPVPSDKKINVSKILNKK
ncbi:fructoselysine and glucoselysine-specific PTS system IIB component [Virgibacillus halotolerans]|uniref:PTS sugar transporter subunit IIB n=1 Tax=Virgibacillus halotolerans TaxID=1071053 RepID=UPI00195F2CF3|nr:PTS sugar transporter subunit IIB [Virgibacillus halotolerans]MBM7599014.1 fructoselysine and glucoselysine-specific PTS system IIB component [Virgibacillus halotolerans]